MTELKKLSPDAVPAALERALRYRLLNEPMLAESICRDVLRADPGNQEALTHLLLCLTDQFHERLAENFPEAKKVVPQLEGEYRQIYYEGLIYERRAHAHLRRGGHGSGQLAYEWFAKAMDCYERAAKLRPAGNDDPILRWNTCARLVDRRADVKPVPRDTFQPLLE